ncbi:MFS transporter [Nonomuraea sp. MG754425]|uniref:MFS transporter n=1 Tax=Nonomuraea sp. MG754425 TaxID=2570319 RepID=UPI001F009CC0|nr:MFS transporter [Nonomuraea sp. MG754425]MCF6472307.1 MFS transporter [Nonomuraea sp. MG754425]
MTARSALRRYLLVNFLTWLPPGLMMATMVLLMTERGLGLAQIGLAVTVFSIVTVSLELPTGGLADVLGRRVVLAASAAFTVAGLTLISVSTTFWMFLLSGVLKGVARALSSGPATSWYVDTLHGIEGHDADLRPGLAKGGAMESAALCAGVLAGGALPLVVPPSLLLPLAAPPLAGAAAAVVLLVVAVFALPEPARERRSAASVLREVPASVVGGVRLVLGGAVLRRLMLAAAASGVVLMSIELLTPGRLAALAGTAEKGGMAYAMVTALGFAGSAAGSAFAPRAARLAGGSARGAIAGTVLTALSVGALAATAGLDGPSGLVSAALAYVLLFAGGSVTGVLCLELTHKAVTAAERTTVTSTSSIALQSGGTVANLTLGVLAAQAGLAAAWGLAALVMLASVALFVRMPVPTGSSPARVRPARSGSG